MEVSCEVEIIAKKTKTKNGLAKLMQVLAKWQIISLLRNQ